MDEKKVFDVKTHNEACDRISDLLKSDPEGKSPEVISEASALADEILGFWKNIGGTGDENQ